MVSQRVFRQKPFSTAGPNDAVVVKAALCVIQCLTLQVVATQTVIRPQSTAQKSHPSKVDHIAFEKAYRRVLSLVPNFFFHLFPAFVVPLVISGYIQDGNGPVFKQVNGHATEADVAGEHKHVRTVSRSNEALAKELPGQKFEMEVRSQLNAHRLRHQESVRASHPDTQEYG